MKKTVVLLCVLILIAFSYGVAPAADKGVVVTNTSSNPVPVTGNVSITGTPNVNVTKTVPVMENAALSPFWGAGEGSSGIGDFFVFLNVGTVPDGKRLVIEYVGINCITDLDDDISVVTINVYKKEGNAVHLFTVPIPVMSRGETHDGKSSFTMAQNLRLYSDGLGAATGISIYHKKTTAAAFCLAIVSGYTVDVP